MASSDKERPSQQTHARKGTNMNSDVQKSVDAKTHYFDEYLIVPDSLRPEVDAFCAEVAALGEQCADFNAFENRFASEGLSEKFVALTASAPEKIPANKRTAAGIAQSRQEHDARKPKGDSRIPRRLRTNIRQSRSRGAHPEGKSRAHDRKRHHGRLHKNKERYRRRHQPFRIPFE